MNPNEPFISWESKRVLKATKAVGFIIAGVLCGVSLCAIVFAPFSLALFIHPLFAIIYIPYAIIFLLAMEHEFYQEEKKKWTNYNKEEPNESRPKVNS